ncbi:MAG TPA: multiheme c-type cytochrome [Ignavibacteria bacterium]|jgi:hypothetical protein
MKIKQLSGLIIITSLLFLSSKSGDDVNNTEQYKYVGVNACTGACHKSDAQGRQFQIWEGSKHSQAYKNLQTPEADQIAKDKGFTTPAAETPQCVKCHVLGKDIDQSELADTFDKTQGVQCETCHGPGSEYKKLSIMKDRQKAVESGLIIHEEGESFCTGCHNAESPTFKGFSYDEYWAKIKHKKQP